MLSALATALALTAAWAPAVKFSLVCQGTQTGYQEINPVKQTIPWAETFTVDLGKGVYCSNACASSDPISAISATELDLDNTSGGGSSSVKRFLVAGGAYQSAEVVGGNVTNDRFHLEKTGTCTLKP